ncbi:exocyst complex subunit Sec15-like protein [Hyphopichia burtonii NRRL Y-1933]|uniref:Exocyst complex component SEC15 n=1 Tax=Hyphopichia burtonii NRRL Y-1933 TaxID=984485 RepID=A0A1E4RH79_9ASCO|nr:exocyst complex subunit Sec15-like protein [Hyphopichia burtonii NRRL Y-1933]ODV66571.1 exocyst complex subunit Sec15-like protein [Hyphopichia burtonii NRRL Y-1933]
MAPSANGNGVTSDTVGNGSVNGPKHTGDSGIDTIQLENLLLRDEDIFQTSLNSEDYLESLAPIIKGALKVNGLAELIHKLNDIVKDKDEELNDLSLNSTNNINSCIDSIDRVNFESTDLNKNLVQVSSILNKSVYELMSRKKSLIKSKETTSKINETNVVLSLCIQVLEITNKIHELIKQHKYFSALKLIDELTNIHLPKVENFSFAIKIYDSIPHLTKMIKDESFESLCRWLSILLEKKIRDLGPVLFANLQDLQENWDKIRKNKDNTTFLAHRLNSPTELAMRDPMFNYDLTEDEEMGVDLTELYDAILVYQTLNELNLLSQLYHKEWLKRYNRVIYPITSSVSNDHKYSETIASFPSTESLAEYLKKISAFFVADKQINLATKFQIRNNHASNDLWESYIIKLKPVLLNHLHANNFNLDELTDYKDLIGNFLQIMENHHYKTIELYEILVIIFRDYFGPELIQQFRLDFNESIQSDHYMPLVVNDKQDYDNVMKICWYKDDASFAPQNVKSVPISFPFSEDYVHYCLGIRSLLEDILDFISQHYNTDLSELNNIIVNDIFEKVLGDRAGIGISSDIKEFIQRNSNNKEIIAQSYTNLEYYLFSLYEIGKLINRRLRACNGIGIHNIDVNGTFTLKAIDLFTQVRKFSEDAIFNMVDQKIRELLDMVEYDDWLPEIRNQEPNYSIKDFALFLENLFTSIFSNLPLSFRTLGLFRSYDFVAEHFLLTLKDVEVCNRIAIENFNLDIKHLEESMSNLHSTQQDSQSGGGNVALQSTFTELRQCIDLLLLDNYEEYIKNPTFRMRKFDRVKLEDGLKLIAKMQPTEEEEAAMNISGHDDTFNSSVHSIELTNQSMLSGATASKFAKFSSKFKKNTDY